MNSPLLGRLLLVNKGIRLSGKESELFAAGPRRSLLQAVKPVRLTPVRPALSLEGSSAVRQRSSGKLVTALFLSTVAIGLVVVASVCALGMERARHARENYQLSVQLRQKERELHRVQQAFHALEAFAAVTARDLKEAQVLKAAMPLAPPTVPRVTRVQFRPIQRRMPLCSKRSNTGA